MQISFEQNKSCACYENLVNNENDRDAIKKFSKVFNKNILTAVIKTHTKLKLARNASFYNATVSDNNKIELKKGLKDKEPQVLKVRVQDGYRKFFYFFVEENTNLEFCLVKNWVGQFPEVTDIHVYDVNNHDYR